METPKKSEKKRVSVPVCIRCMIIRDRQEVLVIERESFEFPWEEEDFIRFLQQRNCIGIVADHDDGVVGFMLYEFHKTLVHVLDFAVEPSMRRKGVGLAMVEKLKSKLSSDRRTRLTLEVRETNLKVLQFFRSQGFVAVSILRDFYEDTTEDAYVMEYHITRSNVVIPANRISRYVG